MLAGCMAMYACQIDSTDNAPPCLRSPHLACVGTRGNALRHNLLAPISPFATGVCGWCDYTFPLLDPRLGC